MHTCFGEHQIGRVISKILLQQHVPAADLVAFKSEVHGVEIDLKQFKKFIMGRLHPDAISTFQIMEFLFT
jgi:hypothetical protein